eukprot:s3347_g5.t1
MAEPAEECHVSGSEEEEDRRERVRKAARRVPHPTIPQNYNLVEADFWRHRHLPVGSVLEYTPNDVAFAAAGKISVLVVKSVSNARGVELVVRPVESEEESFRKKFKSLFKGQRKNHHLCYMDDEGQCPLSDQPGVHLTNFYWFPPGTYAPNWLTRAATKLVESGVGLCKEAEREEAGGDQEEDAGKLSETERRLNRLRAKGTPHISFATRGDSPALGSRLDGRRVSPRVGALRKPTNSDYAPAIQDAPPRQVKTEIVVNDSDSEKVKREKSSRRKSKKKGIADTLAQAVAVRQDLMTKSSSSKRRRSRSRSRHKDKKRRSRRRRSSNSRSSEDDSSSGSSDISLQPPLKKRSEKDPGSVFKLLLSQAAEQLAQEGLETDQIPSNLSSGQKVKLYTFYQLALRPHLDIRSRDNKELALLAKSLDLLQEGDLPRLADVLAARMIAVETATRQGWQTARFLELQSADDDGTAPPHILLAAQRHCRQVEKAGGKGSWTRSTSWSGDWAADARPKGKGTQPKGKGKKGKGKAKGGKGGWNAWNTNDKGKAAEKEPKPDG